MSILKDLDNYLRKNLDKVAHFGISLFCAQVLAILITPIPAGLLVFLGGVYYEVRGNNDFKDLAADALGCTVGVLLFIIARGGI